MFRRHTSSKLAPMPLSNAAAAPAIGATLRNESRAALGGRKRRREAPRHNSVRQTELLCWSRWGGGSGGEGGDDEREGPKTELRNHGATDGHLALRVGVAVAAASLNEDRHRQRSGHSLDSDGDSFDRLDPNRDKEGAGALSRKGAGRMDRNGDSLVTSLREITRDNLLTCLKSLRSGVQDISN